MAADIVPQGRAIQVGYNLGVIATNSCSISILYPHKGYCIEVLMSGYTFHDKEKVAKGSHGFFASLISTTTNDTSTTSSTGTNSRTSKPAPSSLRTFIIIAVLVVYSVSNEMNMVHTSSLHPQNLNVEGTSPEPIDSSSNLAVANVSTTNTTSSIKRNMLWPPPIRPYPFSGSRSNKACGWDYYELVEGKRNRAKLPYCR